MYPGVTTSVALLPEEAVALPVFFFINTDVDRHLIPSSLLPQDLHKAQFPTAEIHRSLSPVLSGVSSNQKVQNFHVYAFIHKNMFLPPRQMFFLFTLLASTQNVWDDANNSALLMYRRV